jgi:hypothetical protein
VNIEPSPTPEEAAAIMAALEAMREGKSEKAQNLKRSRWRMAGLLGHPPPRHMKAGDSLWSYSRWEGMV